MTTFQIECFLALSQSLNFTQTAEDMFVSQPTLSRSIASLEHELGVQLLVRNTKAVELTAAGKCFSKNAASFLQNLHQSIDDAKQARDGLTGQLKLGIQQDAFEPAIVDLVNRFRAEHPTIDIRIIPLSISKLQHSINSGSLDLIIGAGESNLNHPGRILLSERPECAVLPLNHPLATRSCIAMSELKDEKFVAMSPLVSTSGHYLLLKYANDAGFLPNIVANAPSVSALMMMVACGVGIGVLYQDLAVNAHDRLRFVPLNQVECFCRYLMWDEDSRNPALNAFLRCAEEFLEKDNMGS